MTKNEDEESTVISGGAAQEYDNANTVRTKGEYEVMDQIKMRWTGSALDLVIEFLYAFYAKPANANAAHSIIAEDLIALGSAIITSKKHGQIFQVVYVKEKAK